MITPSWSSGLSPGRDLGVPGYLLFARPWYLGRAIPIGMLNFTYMLHFFNLTWVCDHQSVFDKCGD